jgi:hypothetical protein
MRSSVVAARTFDVNTLRYMIMDFAPFTYIGTHLHLSRCLRTVPRGRFLTNIPGYEILLSVDRKDPAQSLALLFVDEKVVKIVYPNLNEFNIN